MKLKMSISFVLIFSILFVIFSEAFAANWFVDKNATGANNGTSWLNAWRSFSSIVWGSSGVKAGDTLFISGGSTSKTYTEKWAVGASGTSGSPITIRAGQDAGHNGTVIFDYNALGASAIGSSINLNGRDYITINGEYNGNRNIHIKNIYNTSNKLEARGVYGAGSTDIKITYVEFDNVNIGVKLLSGTTRNEVSYCKVRGRGDGLVVIWDNSETTFDKNLIHHNELIVMLNSNTGGGPDTIQCTFGTSIYNNTFDIERTTETTSSQHADAIQTTGSYTKIYNNFFKNIGDSGFDLDGTGVSGRYDYHHIYIYNNVWAITDLDVSGTYPEFMRFYNIHGSLENLKILNNLFVDNTTFTTIRIFGNSGATGAYNEIKNNIWYNCGGSSISLFNIATNSGENWGENSFDIKNNVYYNSRTVPVIYLGTSYTAATWVKYYDTSGSTKMPLFKSYSLRNENNDYRLQSNDTVAKDRGLSFMNYFTIDKDNVLRPNSAWDIGPYETLNSENSSISIPSGFELK